jgi:serine/threonine-protein kinase
MSSTDRDTALPHAATVAEPVTLADLSPVVLAPSGGAVDAGPRYSTIEGLGEGGMGEVRLCRDAVIGREIALKTLRGGRDGHAVAVARFVREARIQGQLEHPAVVPVYDLGVDAAGKPFFTMKRVRGRTLEEAIADAEGAEDSGRARRKLLSAFATVCHAIEYAHARGVLHRDLKPQNVMLGDFGEVYVLDWGIAKLRAEDVDVDARPITLDEGDEAKRTAAGDVLGTPGYMAPEQIRGDAGVDARADVYALGAILFEILAGRPLHEGASVAALAASTLAGVEARPSVRVPGREVAPELEAICVRATALDASERFADVAELRDAVERFLEGDRDVALRRELARDHAARAAGLEARALDGDVEARRLALEQAGRALALDPESPAAAIIVRLMSHPPRETPPEVAAEIERERDAAARGAARTAGWALLAMLAAAPAEIALGIRDWPLMGARIVLVALAAGACFAPVAAGGSVLRRALIACAAVLLLFGIARTAGPLVTIPVGAAAVGVGLALFPRPVPAWVGLALCIGSVGLPLALEATGVLDPSYVLDGDRLCIVPHALAFGPGTVPFLALVGVLPGCAIILYLAKIRARLAEAQRIAMIQRWQLEQLAPTVGQA